jgi:asparagine synthetase B (glutamine-hydrolysing)
MILYFNQAYLEHPDIQQTIIDHGGRDTFSKLKNLANINPGHAAWYCRKGTNLLPFKNELIHVPGIAMPNYDPDHTKSWSEVTDQRCQDLRASHWHKPWVLMWSGGIDSTAIVSAMIRNLAPSDLDNITILCNAFSVWENPKFYFDHIRPNFKVVDSHDVLNQDFDGQDIYFISGDTADQLFGSAGGYLHSLYQSTDLLYTNVVKHKDCAIDFIAAQLDVPDRHFAEWYYHVLMTNANSVGISVTTVHELLAWSGFNNAWVSNTFRFMYSGNWQNIKTAKSYIDRFVHWYSSDDYQQWAMNSNNAGEKLGTTASEYKLAAKKYIHTVDHNDYYFQFKIKMPSTSLLDRRCPWGNWCCIDDNWNLLNLTDHQDQILRMLPDHLA